MVSFREKVYKVVKTIPSGNVLTYKQVAGKAGNPRAYRAVGNILHENIDPQVPCHRVICSDGTIGGYRRGKRRKIQILKQEGVYLKRSVLSKTFFNQPTLKAAKALLGKFLVRRYCGKELSLMIDEVEAYDGPNDKASHASYGLTSRNKVMFQGPGMWYVYFIYGNHWMLNIVTGPKNYPAAVLIRGTKQVQGPGRITKYLHIDKRFNGLPANKNTGLWIEDRGVKLKPSQIKALPRIGVDYAGIWAHKLYRFKIKG